MRKGKLISAFLALALSIPTATAPFAVAVEDSLDKYVQIVADFNDEYGTTYQVATHEQLERIGKTTDEITSLFNEMSEDEFYDYLYDAYLLDMSDKSNNNQGESAEMCTTNIELSVNAINPPIEQQSTTATQYYYYRGSTTESLYLTATWSYGAGSNRYSPYVKSMGYTYTDGHYPYYAPYDTTHSLKNSATEMECSYTCDKYIAEGVTDATVWTVNVTFTAGGGDVWGSQSL